MIKLNRFALTLKNRDRQIKNKNNIYRQEPLNGDKLIK